MPEVLPNNSLWRRGGRLNQKRHFELSEEEKTHIAKCQGIKHSHPCKNPVFRCSECGNYGCDQVVVQKCTIQGFKNDKCLHCGAVGTRIPVMESEFDEYVAEWNKEIELVQK